MNESISLNKRRGGRLSKKIKKTKEDLAAGNVVLQDKIAPAVNLNQTNQSQKGKRAKQERGLIYVGHLPPGFYENELRSYFKQFGTVTNCRVNRSPDTGKSKGFGYVEFQDLEVAAIAAETMNNYLMFKRRLIAKCIPPAKQKPELFRAPAWSEKKFPLQKARETASRIHNNNSYIDYEQECKSIIEGVQKKLDKLKDLGIDYYFQCSDIPSFEEDANSSVDTVTLEVAGLEEQNKSVNDNETKVKNKIGKSKQMSNIKKKKQSTKAPKTSKAMLKGAQLLVKEQSSELKKQKPKVGKK